ncbi:hypothetical protein [Actinopolymorpha alba]|uniref:hypothetical protein n=1 Tax=Actinopolymorpha alba TaxID=533267 RepID=UPI00037DB256|nr:hypothetical protein [Actinopolymorpha alba]
MTIKRGLRFLIVGVFAGLLALLLFATESPTARLIATLVWLAALVCGLVFLVCAAAQIWRWTKR